LKYMDTLKDQMITLHRLGKVDVVIEHLRVAHGVFRDNGREGLANLTAVTTTTIQHLQCNEVTTMPLELVAISSALLLVASRVTPDTKHHPDLLGYITDLCEDDISPLTVAVNATLTDAKVS